MGEADWGWGPRLVGDFEALRKVCCSGNEVQEQKAMKGPGAGRDALWRSRPEGWAVCAQGEQERKAVVGYHTPQLTNGIYLGSGNVQA